MDEDYLASNPAEDTSSTGESDDEHYASENALPAETEVEPNPAEDTLLSFGLPESNQFLLMEANGKPEPARDAASRRRLFLDHLKPGQQIDVLDSVDKWAEAEVLQVDYSRRRVEVTFLFWSDRWNTWIEFGTPAGAKRLAEPGTKTYQEGGVLQLNHRIECCDGDVWREAVVIDTTPLQVKVHFMKWHSKFDEWLERDSPRIRPFGRKKRIAILKQQQARKRRQVLMKPAADAVERRERTISSRSDCYTHYVGALEKLQLFVYNVEGDGNCLFRAVAHQVYGDDELHKLVRKACCDYMEREATFFEQFVEGDREDFLRYLTYKRRNAVWGDDPEVQALCEIYNRSAEIWAYDHRIGARKLRTFHEPLESTVEAETAETPSAAVPGDDATRPGRPASSASPSPEPVGDRGRSEIREEPGLPVPDAAAAIPMRLSYYGGGHYDSIVTRDHVRVISRLRPGMLEEAALQRSDAREPRRVRSNSAAEAQNPPSEGKEEEAELDLALEASRLDFDAQFEDLDAALVASVESYEKDMGSAQAASRTSEEEMLKQALEASLADADRKLTPGASSDDEALLKAAIEASVREAPAAGEEDDMLRAAIEASKQESHHIDEEMEVQKAILASQAEGDEDAMIAMALQASLQDNAGHAQEGMAFAGYPGDEDEELRRALELSRNQS